MTLSWKLSKGDPQRKLLDGNSEVAAVNLGYPSAKAQKQVDELRRIVEAAQTSKKAWSIDLKKIKDWLGPERMRFGTRAFGHCELDSLSRIAIAQEWSGGEAIRLGFGVSSKGETEMI